MGIFGMSNDVIVTEEVESATSEKSVEEDWGIIINICDRAGKSSEEAKNYLKAIIKRLYNNDPHVGIKAVTVSSHPVEICLCYSTSPRYSTNNKNIVDNMQDEPGPTICCKQKKRLWILLRMILQRGLEKLYRVPILPAAPAPHVALSVKTSRPQGAGALLDACIKNAGKIFHTEVASREFENDFSKLMTKAHPTVARKLRESLKRWSENEFKTDVQLNLIPSLYSKLKSSGYDFSSLETVSTYFKKY
ncbi:hypothetical protein NQ317_008017 [Molorchus minor]|uniref:VHS domain-containing protein n=1 Tax=Molorchus minor TaxID=1323400 RepID=A0ABQ9JW55_9CUCU|nr:hypothetical protein NQ317_008017 [Molorchus minor]